MLKRLLILLLAIMMVLSFAACDDKEDAANENGKQTTEENDKFTGLASGDYARLMQSEHFYMTYTIYTMGMDFEGSQAVSDDIIASKVNMYDEEIFTILNDNIFYEIDSASKTYSTTTLNEDELSTYKTDYEEMSYVNSGNGVIASLVDTGVDTDSYDYDEYVIKVDLSKIDEEDLAALEDAGIDTDSSVTIRYYLKNDCSLYAITCTVMDLETVMVVHELTDQVPGDMLKIPDGYVEA